MGGGRKQGSINNMRGLTIARSVRLRLACGLRGGEADRYRRCIGQL